jgi:uncharacterized protein (TIGR02421 family)
VEALSGPRHSRIDPAQRTDYLGALQEWDARLSAILRTVRVLEAVRWPAYVEREFFARGARELPHVAYRLRPTSRALARLSTLERQIQRRLGASDPGARLLLRRADSAKRALRLIAARGTADFAPLSRELYGSSQGSNGLRQRLNRFVAFLESAPANCAEAQFSAEHVAMELALRLRTHFSGAPVRLTLVDNLAADACVGGSTLKLRRTARFTTADIDLLEVHEGWVHVGTTLAGRRQPIFRSLGRAVPCATATQEGLAVLTELLTGVCVPARRRRLALRLRGVMMAEEGADFLDVFRFMRQNVNDREAYRQSARVFRGGLPEAGPFTKDLTYGLGLLALLNQLRSASGDQAKTIGLLFSGKASLQDIPDLAELHNMGLLTAGEFVPAIYHDIRLKSALAQLPHFS